MIKKVEELTRFDMKLVLGIEAAIPMKHGYESICYDYWTSEVNIAWQ